VQYKSFLRKTYVTNVQKTLSTTTLTEEIIIIGLAVNEMISAHQ